MQAFKPSDLPAYPYQNSPIRVPDAAPVVITQTDADLIIQALIKKAGGLYNPDISTTANLIIAIDKNHFPVDIPVQFDNVTFVFNANDRRAVDARNLSKECFSTNVSGIDRAVLQFPPNCKLANCVFQSEGKLSVRFASFNKGNIISLEGDAMCHADPFSSTTVYLSGEKTEATVYAWSTAHVNKPGARAFLSGGIAHLNVPGSCAVITNITSDVFENVDNVNVTADWRQITDDNRVPPGLYMDYYNYHKSKSKNSYADVLIKQGRIEELVDLARFKIESSLSTAEDINRGVYYLTRAALAGHPEASTMTNEFVKNAIADTDSAVSSGDSMKNRLVHLRIAANAGHIEASNYLINLLKTASLTINSVKSTDKEIEAGFVIIDMACMTGYIQALMYRYVSLSNTNLLDRCIGQIEVAEFNLSTLKKNILRGLAFLNRACEASYDPAIIYRKDMGRIWFDSCKIPIVSLSSNSKLIQKGALFLEMACQAGHEPAITFRKGQSALWFAKAIIKIESPISNQDERNTGLFYLKLACDAGHKPAVEYMKTTQYVVE